VKKNFDWNDVWQNLLQLANTSLLPNGESLWRAGQDKSLRWIARQLQAESGVLIADEVGLGKTRLAIALAVCVAACGGTVAILIPPGLTSQWCDDELRGFLKQIEPLDFPWIPSSFQTKVLRTYPDLFQDNTQTSAYPLSRHANFVFLSHRFGLPQHLPTVKRHELWALPFLLKKEFVDGRSVRGAGNLQISPAQRTAVEWLATHIPPKLKTSLLRAELGPVSNAAFDQPENAILFRHLLGELIGDFDLVIIDEAHKSRAGAEGADPAVKRANTVLQSRMSMCLNEILMRPGSASKHAKRVALTATPMEMDAKQWTSVLHRLGLERERVAGLQSIVMNFSEAVQQIRFGSSTEIANLETAAIAFQNGLRPFVTRRLWRDHPAVQRFAATVVAGETAHPHRRSLPRVTPLSGLAPEDKLQLAYTEGIAITSKGIRTANNLKSAGSRYSQGLPLFSESAEEVIPAELPTSAVTDKPVLPLPPHEKAKRQRQAYWLKSLDSLSLEMGRVAEKSRWSLQWHPRIGVAISLIEELTGQGKKVLVFGEFLEPIRALDRALNIRHYLRHVRDHNPIPVPTGVKVGDPDVLRWLESADLAFPEERKQTFVSDADKLGDRYTQDRAGLREVCRGAAEQFFLNVRPRPYSIAPTIMDSLITWLVQQLCVGDQLSVYSNSRNREQIREAVEQILLDLRDADPVGKAQTDDADAERPFDWEAVIREQVKELERDLAGNYVFRMSPFSQLLFGDTKAAARRVRQNTFNNPHLNPQVLIGQSDVASEGLNLHRACRSVVLFHLDWNPGRIEQQIGRVDRQNSAWMTEFETWSGHGDIPYIDIYTVAIEGTYDALRTRVVQERAKVLRSQLFGETLPLEQLNRLDEDTQAAVGRIKIDFRP